MSLRVGAAPFATSDDPVVRSDRVFPPPCPMHIAVSGVRKGDLQRAWTQEAVGKKFRIRDPDQNSGACMLQCWHELSKLRPWAGASDSCGHAKPTPNVLGWSRQRGCPQTVSVVEGGVQGRSAAAQLLLCSILMADLLRPMLRSLYQHM